MSSCHDMYPVVGRPTLMVMVVVLTKEGYRVGSYVNVFNGCNGICDAGRLVVV